MKRFLLLSCTALFLAAPVQAQEVENLPAGTYTLDKSHASLTFSVNHMGFSHYTAGFDEFDATLELDPAHPEDASMTASVNPLSLDLPSPPEGFVKEISTGESWLNGENFPKITYTSNRIEKTGENTADIHGDLELLGVKKPVILHATFNGGYEGIERDPNARVGFSANGSFNRSDFGMSFGIPEPGSKMGVGDEISVMIEAEFSGPAMEKAAE